MDDLSQNLSQIVKQGKEYNSVKIFPTKDDQLYVENFIKNLLKTNTVFYTGKNAINYYLNKDSIKLPIELYSSNIKKDTINISKYLSKKYRNVQAKLQDDVYKIFWEGKFEPVVILYFNNIENKNTSFIDLKILLMKIFYEFSLPRDYFQEWKYNLEIIDQLLNVSNINVSNKKIKHNPECDKIIKLLESEKNFFYTGMQYLRFNKIISQVEYLDLYALDPKSIISKIKKNNKNVKVEKQPSFLNFIPEAQVVKINKKVCVIIYPIEKCYSHTGYYANVFNVLLNIIYKEPHLFKKTVKHYQDLKPKFKYQGVCIGPLPKPIDKISNKLIYPSKKK
tara:strand:+ start:1939 stop:2946 length:1008 start_codon:yes stop_codon:yes gene_type:complete